MPTTRGHDEIESCGRILEAPQNVEKYGCASSAKVGLSCPDGHLEFTVTDDGNGTTTTTTSGSLPAGEPA